MAREALTILGVKIINKLYTSPTSLATYLISVATTTLECGSGQLLACISWFVHSNHQV